MLLPREDLQLLSEIGFLAISRGQLEDAEKIFVALEIASPTKPGGYAGQALLRIFGLKALEALQTLDRGLAAVVVTERSELLAFKGLALRCAGLHAAADRALRDAGDVPLAQALLGDCSVAAQED